VGTRLQGRLATVYYATLIGGLAVALRLAVHQRIHDLIFTSLEQAMPLVIVALAVVIARSPSDGEFGHAKQSQSVVVALTAAFCALVQYPFASPIYFCYIVPLLLLAVIPVVQAIPGRKQPALSALAGFYLIFGALDLEPFRLEGLGGPLAREQLEVLDLPRGGLRTGVGQARWYREAVNLLRARAATGAVYAGPDAPEIYFLAELRNPTPAIFDYMVGDTLFHQRLVETLDQKRISAVALKHGFIHSPPLEPEVIAAFERRFPAVREIGVNFFTIRWAPER
jgi:hypothetical protein